MSTTVEVLRDVPPDPGRGGRRPLLTPAGWAFAAALLVLVVGVLLVSERGIQSERLRNPDPPADAIVYDGVPRTYEPWLGIEHWPYIAEGICLVAAVGFWGTFLVRSRRSGTVHPGLVLLSGSTLMMLSDPYVNWGFMVTYDPRLLHLPETWPFVSLAPNIQPILGFVGYPFYFLIPGLIGAAIHRRWVLPRLSPASLLARRPLLTAFLVGFVVAFAFDVAAEATFIRAEVFILSHVPDPVVHFGPHQWPVFHEPMLFSIPMGLSAVLLTRDDRGRTPLQRFAERRRLAGRRSLWAQIGAAWACYFVAYVVVCVGVFALIRVTGNADNVEPAPTFLEQKVYDPQGRYRQAGIPGPYYEGIWSGPQVDQGGPAEEEEAGPAEQHEDDAEVGEDAEVGP